MMPANRPAFENNLTGLSTESAKDFSTELHHLRRQCRKDPETGSVAAR
jgi:hypothetical protein